MYSIQSAARNLWRHEPYGPKKQMLKSILGPNAPQMTNSQAVAATFLLLGNSTLYYSFPNPNHLFNPLDDFERQYKYVFDWYFIAGTLYNNALPPQPIYAYTVAFASTSLAGGGGYNAPSDVAIENAFMVFTSFKEPKVFNSPMLSVPANAVSSSKAPFLFAPASTFYLKTLAPGQLIFPLQLHAEDGPNQIKLDLVLNPSFGEDKPLFQGTDTGYVGGLGEGYRYYSYVQLPTTGTVTMGNSTPVAVKGKSWLDSQKGSVGQTPIYLARQVLGVLQVLTGPPKKMSLGWIWISVMLSDGTSLALSAGLFGDQDGTPILAAEADAGYTSIQAPDGSSRALKKPLHLRLKYTGPYVSQAEVTGMDGLSSIDLLVTAISPNSPSVILLPNMLPFCENPAIVSGSIGGIPVQGVGTLETCGSQRKSEATGALLTKGGLAATPENIQIIEEADWKFAETRGWTTLCVVIAIIIATVILTRKSSRLVAPAEQPFDVPDATQLV